MRLRPLLANLALVLGSVAVTLLLVEIALRVVPLNIAASAGTDRGFFSKFDPKLGWAPVPGVKGYHSDHGFSVLVEQNSLGLRAPEDVGPERRNGDYRALVLGDSYVWGYGAAQDEIFTNPNVHGAKGLELVNMGVSGYGTDQELLLYRELGSRFDVDEVVLAFTTYNDIANNMSSSEYGYGKPYFTFDGMLVLQNGHLQDRLARRAWNWLSGNSLAFSLINTGASNLNYLVSRYLGSDDSLAEAIDRIRTPDELNQKDMKGVALTAAIIGQLRDEVEARGDRFEVVFVPYKPHIVALQENDHPLVKPLAEQLAAMGIETASPYRLFLDEARKGVSLFNSGDNHFNAAGHKLFGRFLAEQIQAD